MSLATINQNIISYYQQILHSDLVSSYFSYVSQLSSREIIAMVIIAAVLILIMAYRKLGLGAVFGLCLIYFFVYVVFYSNLFDNWQKEKTEETRRMQLYNAEMQKR